MFVILGTLPYEELDILQEKIKFENGFLKIGNFKASINLGSSALVLAAYQTSKALNLDPPLFITVGDIGDGRGSKKLYQYIPEYIKSIKIDVLTMHYLMPNIFGIRRIIDEVKDKNIVLIADAGSMYAAKSAKIARYFDIFTPDAAEMAFLADDKATHPAYIKKILFEIDYSEILYLVKKAYEFGNVPDILLLKGPKDYIIEKGKVIEVIDKPSFEASEAIGGTGDTLVGILSSLIYKGFDKIEAAIKAAKINRLSLKLSNPTPATKIAEIIYKIEDAVKEVIR